MTAPPFVSHRSGNQLVVLFYSVLLVIAIVLWISNVSLDLQATTTTNRVQSQRRESFVNQTTTTNKKSSQRSTTKREQQQPIQPFYEEGVEFHVVFSTGCNAFQDWQSYVFFYQALQSGQTGHVTRVASGCSDEATAQALRDNFQEQIVHSMLGNHNQHVQFHLHITPDYSKLIPELTYKFFNKPLGLRHWMQEALGYSQDTTDKMDEKGTIIAILDPDQFIMKPLRSNYTGDSTMRWTHPTDDGTYTIRKGRPLAQLYSFGSRFMEKVNTNISKVVQAAPLPDNTKSPLYEWTATTVKHHFDAGPPYMAVASDMYAIVSTWAAVAVPVYELTTGHLSEMYAYSTAAAHVGLPHALSYSFMVSNPEMGAVAEGWDGVDAAPVQDLCGNDETLLEASPPILHYCQRAYLGPYFFSKYKLPKQFLSDCSHPLLLDPLEAEDYKTHWPLYYESSVTPNGQFNKISPVHRKRHAFLLCQIIAKVNAAVEFYKHKHCDSAHVNLNKTFVFPMDKGKKRIKVARLQLAEEENEGSHE